MLTRFPAPFCLSLIPLLCVLNAPGAVAATKGHLVIIGGGNVPRPVLQQFIDLAGGATKAHIRVLPMACSDPAGSGESQVKEFESLGVTDVSALIINRERAAAPELLAELDKATGIFFTGGDQSRLATNLVDTPAQVRLIERYHQGAVIGGTSAGAAIMSALMITGEQRLKPESADGFTSIQRDNVSTRAGLGFVTNAVIDQHFIARKRQNRLIGLVAEHPELLGVGIDESTALIVLPQGIFEVLGERSVMIFDARTAGPVKADAGENLSIRGVITHLLTNGDRFDPALSQRGTR